MKYTKEEMVKALKLIKDVCNNEDCMFCPFNKQDGGCLFQSDYPPTDWKIKDEVEQVWRATLD